MEIQHATLEQVRQGRDGRRILVESDVLDVVGQLKQIDPHLSVLWNEFGGYFTIVEKLPDGSESLVTTVPELTPKLIDYVRILGSRDYSYIQEAEKADREAEKHRYDPLEEEMGEKGEHIAYIIRKDDREVNNKAFIPRDIDFGKEIPT